MCGCGNTVKYTRKETEVYGGNIEVTAICEMYKMSVSVSFVSENKMTASPNTVVGQAVTQGDVSLLFSGERSH
jgi:hypothetical protein